MEQGPRLSAASSCSPWSVLYFGAREQEGDEGILSLLQRPEVQSSQPVDLSLNTCSVPSLALRRVQEMTVMGMVVSPLGWRVNTSSEKQGRMDSSAGSLYGTRAEAPAPFPGKPRALLVLFLPISPTTFDPQGTIYFTQAYPTFCFVFCCLLCLHASPFRASCTHSRADYFCSELP